MLFVIGISSGGGLKFNEAISGKMSLGSLFKISGGKKPFNFAGLA